MVYTTAFVTLLALSVAGASEAGPYLLRSIEMSVARSQKECGGHIVKVLRNLEAEKRLTVSKDNQSLATTRDSTVHVDCIFVGPNEHKQNQWIFYIAIASTNRQESRALLDLLRKKFNGIVRID